MAVTLLEAMKYSNRAAVQSYLKALTTDSVLLLNLPPLPPRSRWQRFKDSLRRALGYRLVLRHKDHYCEEDY